MLFESMKQSISEQKEYFFELNTEYLMPFILLLKDVACKIPFI